MVGLISGREENLTTAERCTTCGTINSTRIFFATLEFQKIGRRLTAGVNFVPGT